jgi:site-specific DNA-cytosine methylase
MIKHASIVPLIGGETIGSEKAFGSRPNYILSYEPFYNNDQHILNYYDHEVPYYLLDKGENTNQKVDVISSVCPCAGLSMLSHGYGDHNQNNKWMIQTAKYVLGTIKPEVFWGENAPGLAGKIGKNVREELYSIGLENGYSMTIYRTKSLLHGIPQVRERSFYFFWKGNKTPILNYYNTPYTPIEDVINSCQGLNSMMEPINPKTPSKDDPYYRFILEYIHNGISHKQFSEQVEPSKARGNDVAGYIEKQGYNYLQVGEWMAANGYEKEVEKCKYKHAKLEAGNSIMRRGTIVPKDYIGAFVGHYPYMLTHPIEDRYITYREGLKIMGMPDDFVLLNPKKNSNHICQNVPVNTAIDMATEVREYLLGNRETIDSKFTVQYNGTQKIEYESKNNNLESFFNMEQ